LLPCFGFCAEYFVRVSSKPAEANRMAMERVLR
jgi:hypothetical protein